MPRTPPPWSSDLPEDQQLALWSAVAYYTLHPEDDVGAVRAAARATSWPLAQAEQLVAAHHDTLVQFTAAIAARAGHRQRLFVIGVVVILVLLVLLALAVGTLLVGVWRLS